MAPCTGSEYPTAWAASVAGWGDAGFIRAKQFTGENEGRPSLFPPFPPVKSNGRRPRKFLEEARHQSRALAQARQVHELFRAVQPVADRAEAVEIRQAGGGQVIAIAGAAGVHRSERREVQ